MILVTGATGVNGKALLNRLSASGIAVRALVRNPAKAEALTAMPHVEIAQGDMARPETLAAALRGVDRAMLISSSDPMMLDVQSNFIDAAAKAGVRHVVKLSGIMPELDSAFRFARMHGEIEKRLGHRLKGPAMDGAGSEFMKSDQMQIGSIAFVLTETIFRETRAEFTH